MVIRHKSHSQRKYLVLHPGEHFVGDATYRVATLLGSCVSITLWQPELRIGAMSHFVLGSRHSRGQGRPLDGRYADEAIALMLEKLRALGVSPRQCEAKIFGGANMFPKSKNGEGIRVGTENGLRARTLLQLLGIPVVAESLFGHGHRKIVFDVASGAVWSRQEAPRAAT